MNFTWPVINSDYAAVTSNRRGFWRFHVPLVVGFCAALFVPAVREWTGVRPLPVALCWLAHLVMFAADLYARTMARWPRTFALVAVVTNLVATASMAASALEPRSGLWAFYFVYPHIAAQAFGLNALVLGIVAAVPFGVAGGWALAGAVPLAESLLPVSLVSAIAALGYFFLGFWKGEQVEHEARKEERTERQAAEEERRRIARELHSTLGAALTEAALWQEVAAASSGSEVNEALARAHDRTRAALDELRSTVGALQGRTIGPQGLEELLRRRIGGLCDAARIGWELKVETGEESVAVGRAYHAAKLVEEAVLNAVRHGRPKSVRVEVDLAGPRLTISDDGRGFDPAAVAPGDGLDELEFHAGALGGRLEIDSAPQAGTRVKLLPRG